MRLRVWNFLRSLGGTGGKSLNRRRPGSGSYRTHTRTSSSTSNRSSRRDQARIFPSPTPTSSTETLVSTRTRNTRGLWTGPPTVRRVGPGRCHTWMTTRLEARVFTTSILLPTHEPEDEMRGTGRGTQQGGDGVEVGPPSPRLPSHLGSGRETGSRCRCVG